MDDIQPFLCWRADRQQQGCQPMYPPHRQAPVAVPGSAQPSSAGAVGQVFPCWSEAVQLPAAWQNAPKCAGEGPAALPCLHSTRQLGCCCPHADPPLISPHPQLLHSLSCSRDPSASILRGEPPLKWGHPPPSSRCYVSLYCFTHCLLTASVEHLLYWEITE